MRKLQTEIIVIGGGATGAGIIRDLALRSFQAILVERRDLSDGTTGRYHGLLHSGARYAVKDPLAAQECIEENRILRRILPQCIEDTGGFFVVTPEDDPAYAERLNAGCQKAGIPIEDVSIADMLRQEPLLNPGITRCLRVPDGAADSFLATRLNARSAQAHGAQILRYHPIQQLMIGEQGSGKRVTGVICHDLVKDEQVQISADLVINAAGAWAGKIAATAGITVQMTPGKGVMLAANHRIVNTVINRCKMPGDGDILVPAHTVAVIGTTDVKVPDPDHFGIEAWEVDLMLKEGEKLIPGFHQMRFLRAWAGVRPLYQETSPHRTDAANRDITRAFVLLDHASRDGIPGLLTITGGKWTTYRKMAEITVDRACELLGTVRPCRTHLEPISAAANQPSATHNHHFLGHRLAEIEHEKAYGQLVCECELATQDDIRQAITTGQAHTLDDIRREVRLGKGPCQASFCTLRAAGLLHQSTISDPPSTISINASLRDFLEERWKGVLPVLWGQQLRQERLNELIYINILNIPALPGPAQSPLAAPSYAPSSPLPERAPDPAVHQHQRPAKSSTQHRHAPVSDVLIIGAGLAGLVTAWQCTQRGLKVKLIAKGAGATHWATGCVDVLGYFPVASDQPITSPQAALADLRHTNPRHPYALANEATLSLAIRSLKALCDQAGYPLQGDLDHNWLLPTAAGALRPTCLAPASMIAGDSRRSGESRQSTSMLIVGFATFLDFFPDLAASNLCAQGIAAEAVTLDLVSLRQHGLVNGMKLARLFDTAEFRREVSQALKPRLGQAQRVGFPAVLGLKHAAAVLADLQAQLGVPVFEMPGLPPSIPGIRLYELLVAAIRQAGGQVFDGMQVRGGISDSSGRRLEGVSSDAAAERLTIHYAEKVVLATGGILGGGILTESDGLVHETTLGLPVSAPASRLAWLDQRFQSAGGHAIFQAGLTVNECFQPVDRNGQPYYDNLFAVGGILGGFDPLRERSLEGVCLASGFQCLA